MHNIFIDRISRCGHVFSRSWTWLTRASFFSPPRIIILHEDRLFIFVLLYCAAELHCFFIDRFRFMGVWAWIVRNECGYLIFFYIFDDHRSFVIKISIFARKIWRVHPSNGGLTPSVGRCILRTLHHSKKWPKSHQSLARMQNDQLSHVHGKAVSKSRRRRIFHTEWPASKACPLVALLCRNWVCHFLFIYIFFWILRWYFVVLLVFDYALFFLTVSLYLRNHIHNKKFSIVYIMIIPETFCPMKRIMCLWIYIP